MAANTITSVGAQLKVQYANDWINLVPQNSLLQQFRDPKAPGMTGKKEELGKDVAVPISWTFATRLGKYWVVPTKVQSGQGFTYTGTNGDLTTLESALQMVLVEVQVQGSAATVRQQVPYTVAATADGSEGKAFENIARLVMDDMRDVSYQRYEISALWGQSGIGTIDSQTVSGSTLTCVLTQASFCPTIWVSSIGARCQFFTGTTIDQGLSPTGYGTITNVDSPNRTVTFTLSTAWATSTTVPAAGDDIYFKSSLLTGGSFYEMVGLYKQLSASTGTFFNVDRAAYPLFQGQTFSAGNAPLTKALIIQAAMKLVDKGNLNDMVCVVPTAAWADLNAEDMALRMFDDSYSPTTSESGSEYLVYSNLNGQIRVVCHPLMKQGYAMLFTPGHVSWVGSSDVTFNTPGLPNEQLFLQIPDSDGYEVRAYTNKALYHSAPAQGLVINQIVSNS